MNFIQPFDWPEELPLIQDAVPCWKSRTLKHKVTAIPWCLPHPFPPGAVFSHFPETARPESPEPSDCHGPPCNIGHKQSREESWQSYLTTIPSEPEVYASQFH